MQKSLNNISIRSTIILYEVGDFLRIYRDIHIYGLFIVTELMICGTVAMVL